MDRDADICRNIQSAADPYSSKQISRVNKCCRQETLSIGHWLYLQNIVFYGHLVAKSKKFVHITTLISLMKIEMDLCVQSVHNESNVLYVRCGHAVLTVFSRFVSII